MNKLTTSLCIICTSISLLCGCSQQNNNIKETSSTSSINNKTIDNTIDENKIEIILEGKTYNLNLPLDTKHVNSLDKSDLAVLRNGYYAKYGHKFKTDEFRKAFEKYDWYNPKYDNVDEFITDKDMDNINLILKVEKNSDSLASPESNNKNLDNYKNNVGINAKNQINENNVYNRKNYSGFIFPYSDKKLLSTEELMLCDKFTLLLAKNELFANKGYIFKDKYLSNYYNNMSWYSKNENIENVFDKLNDIEKKNLNLINAYYNNCSYSARSKKSESEINIEKDLNNDGIKESINIKFKKESSGYSWENYDIKIISNGKSCEHNDYILNLHDNLFFADFDVDDDTIEFYVTADGPSGDPTTIIYQLSESGIKEMLRLDGYITCYDGKGNIYTHYSFTYDKNQLLLSYYNLKNGIQDPVKDKIIGKHLQYKSPLILFKTSTTKSPGRTHAYMSITGIKDRKELKEYAAKTYNDEIVKITDNNELLKIVDIDSVSYKRFNTDNIINIPIKVETSDGLIGWLVHLNGGD